MTTNDDQKPNDTTEADSAAGSPASPVSDTPETDEALVDHMPANATEWSEHYLKLSIHARKLERERNAARVPICIGRPIIEILAKEGVWTSMNGNSVIAADCLFHKNPYQENTEAHRQPGASDDNGGANNE